MATPGHGPDLAPTSAALLNQGEADCGVHWSAGGLVRREATTLPSVSVPVRRGLACH